MDRDEVLKEIGTKLDGVESYIRQLETLPFNTYEEDTLIELLNLNIQEMRTILERYSWIPA